MLVVGILHVAAALSSPARSVPLPFVPPHEFEIPLELLSVPPREVVDIDFKKAAILKADLQAAADKLASFYNVSIYIGSAGPGLDGPIGAAGGVFNRSKPGTPPALPTDLVPGGSITKAATAVLALQLVEQGKLDLDVPITTYTDPWLAKQNPPRLPLAYIWENAAIMNVTTRQLLNMRSGLHDYDDYMSLAWTLMQSTPRDILPLDFIMQFTTNKTLLWPPNGGGAYSGTGYVILGWVLSAASGAASWEELDQAAIFSKLPPPCDASWYANHTDFMHMGACAQYGKRVIPQYVTLGQHEPSAHPKLTDWQASLMRQSCLNGWTMGNILTTSAGLAQFYADLWAGKLLSPASLKQMFTFQPLTIGSVPPAGTPYGLGQMIMVAPLPSDKVKHLTMVGHGGEDWGSGFPAATWVYELNISLAIGINNGESPIGMNTSMTWTQNGNLVTSAFCRTATALYKFRGQTPAFHCGADGIQTS